MPQIRIRQYQFEIPTRYSAGHVLSEAEALALGRLRAENVRNNASKLVAKVTADLPAGKMLDLDGIASLTLQIARYEAEYQFPLPGAEPRSRPSPLEAEARAIAFADLGDGADQGDLDFHAAMPTTLDRARARLERQAQLAQAGLDDLL